MYDKSDIERVRKKVGNRPLKAIRYKCVEDCCNGSKHEVLNCEMLDCSLWPFRMGKLPVAPKRKWK